MKDKELELFEILRTMRSFSDMNRDRDVATVLLMKTITTLAEDTEYADIIIKILAAYSVFKT